MLQRRALRLCCCVHCAAEYAQGSQVFVAKIDALAKRYHSMRRTRGDGNCFYRSFVFAYLEWLLMNWDQQECTRCGQPLVTSPGF
jgi:hypothetical protein